MELSDGVVTLREWCEEDAPFVFEACQDPEILHWIPVIPRPYTMDDALAYVRGEIVPGQFAVVVNGRVAGSVGMQTDDSATGHPGYWCLAEARGQGFITRALGLLCRYAYEELGVTRIELTTDPDNRASQRVAEKVGFRREGFLRAHLLLPDGRRRDSVMFSLLPGEMREESGVRSRSDDSSPRG